MTTFYIYLIIIPIGLLLSVLFISVPSFITMYKMCGKKYFKQLKLLFQLKKKITSCYTIETIINYNLKGVIVRTDTEKSLFFPIISGNKVWVIEQRTDVFETMYITEHTEIGYKWENKKFEFPYQECIYLIILNSKFKKKLKEISKNSIPLESIDKLNDVINSEITSFKRDDKIKSLLK